MKSTTIWITVIIVVVVIIAGAMLFIYNSNTPSSQASGSQTTSSPLIVQNNTQQNEDYNVEIINFAFSPSTITIQTGDTVIWTNMDSVAHTVTSDTGSELNSPSISNGSTYEHTFTAAGNYNYHCSIHPSIKGTIIVQ